MRILRIAAAGLLTAGLAAMASLSVTWVASASAGPFMAALQAFSIKFGLICLASAIGTRFLMPREADVTRPIRPGMASSPSPMLKLLLAVLAAAAVLQAPALARWFAQDQTLLYQITEGKTDDLGLALIPAVILFSMPVVAATAVITFVLSSVLGSLARAQLTFPILAACAALQAGLVVGERFVLGGVRSFGEALSRAVGSSGDTLATAQTTDWFGRHDVVASDMSWRLLWIFAAYLVVTLVSAWLSPAREEDDVPDVAAGRAPEPAIRGVAAASVAEPPIPGVVRFSGETVPAALSPGPGVFSDSSYSVRPRRTLLDTMLMQQYGTYDIQSIPPMARARFSFSSRSGVVRREPDGPDLAAVRADGRTGLVGRHTYSVEDLATGALLGRLVPSGREWDMVHGSGSLVARVREESTGVGPWTYVAVTGDREMCRFTWALQGLSVNSAEMDVEFLEGWDGRFDRVLAIALAPMIEHRARLARQRGM
jgi:hypothetical protein